MEELHGEFVDRPEPLPPHINSIGTVTIVVVQESEEVKILCDGGYNTLVSSVAQSMSHSEDSNMIAATLCEVARQSVDLYMKGVIRLNSKEEIEFVSERN